MDWHKLQNKLFELDPTDPREDLAKLQSVANDGGADIAPTKDYVAESVDVPQGSMPLGLDSISDFAALAGVRIDEKQKMGSAGQAKGKDPMPKAKPGRTKHPLKDKLVGEDDSFGSFVAKQAKHGWKNYNKLDAITTGADNKPSAKTATTKTNTKKVAAQKIKGLPPRVEQQLSKYSDQLNRIFSDKNALKQFDQFINKIAPPKTESAEMIDDSDIKAKLWAALNAKLP